MFAVKKSWAEQYNHFSAIRHARNQIPIYIQYSSLDQSDQVEAVKAQHVNDVKLNVFNELKLFRWSNKIERHTSNPTCTLCEVQTCLPFLSIPRVCLLLPRVSLLLDETYSGLNIYPSTVWRSDKGASP